MNRILNAFPISKCHYSVTAKILLLFFCTQILIPRAGVVWSKIPVALTKEEQAWLQNHPTIRLGVHPDVPPLEFVDKDGAYCGAVSDVVRLISERLNIRMKVKEGLIPRCVP